MQKILNNIIQARAGGSVQRCHTQRKIGEYSVAAHSWGVAMLLMQLFPKDFKRLVSYALVHDIPEAWVGDIPSPVFKATKHLKLEMSVIEDKILKKYNLPTMGELNEKDINILKFCDNLELYLWVREQEYLGNQFLKGMKNRLIEYLKELTTTLPKRIKVLIQELYIFDCKPTMHNIIETLDE